MTGCPCLSRTWRQKQRRWALLCLVLGSMSEPSLCAWLRAPQTSVERKICCVFGALGFLFQFRDFVAHDSKLQFGSLNHGPPADLNTASVCRVRRRRRLAIGGTRKTSARRE